MIFLICSSFLVILILLSGVELVNLLLFFAPVLIGFFYAESKQRFRQNITKANIHASSSFISKDFTIFSKKLFNL
jgi:hypothetical protein